MAVVPFSDVRISVQVFLAGGLGVGVEIMDSYYFQTLENLTG